MCHANKTHLTWIQKERERKRERERESVCNETERETPGKEHERISRGTDEKSTCGVVVSAPVVLKHRNLPQWFCLASAVRKSQEWWQKVIPFYSTSRPMLNDVCTCLFRLTQGVKSRLADWLSYHALSTMSAIWGLLKSQQLKQINIQLYPFPVKLKERFSWRTLV